MMEKFAICPKTDYCDVNCYHNDKHTYLPSCNETHKCPECELCIEDFLTKDEMEI